MLYAAAWKVTLSGVVLLDWPDEMDAVPSIVPQGETDVEPLIRGAAPFIHGRGNVRHTVTFSRVRHCADFHAAAQFLALHVALLPMCADPDDLLIELPNGQRITMAGTVLTNAGQPRAESELFRAEYTLLGGALTAPGLIGEGGDALADDDGTLVME